jgi:hypothetical protein
VVAGRLDPDRNKRRLNLRRSQLSRRDLALKRAVEEPVERLGRSRLQQGSSTPMHQVARLRSVAKQMRRVESRRVAHRGDALLEQALSRSSFPVLLDERRAHFVVRLDHAHVRLRRAVVELTVVELTPS